MDTQLDPQAVNLAKAIRQTESGSNFQAKGKSGEYGAYQFTEPTWNTYSKKHGIEIPLQQATREQQNEVAYKQIKEWKDKGYGVGEIASMWNSGKPDAYKDVNYKGVNKFGVTYDVPAYAKSVATAYQSIKAGQPVGIDRNNPSSVSTPQFPLTSQADIATPTTPTEPTKPGANQPIPGVIDQLRQGKYLGALSSAVRKAGSLATFGGSETMGNVLGTLGGYIASPHKKEYDTSGPTLKEGLLGTAGVITGVASVAGAGGLLNKALLSRGALAKPSIKTILEGALNTRGGETLANLSRQQAQMTLQNYLKEMPMTEVGGKTAREVVKALQALDPSFTKPASFVKNLAKFGISTLIIENLVRRVFGERASSAVATMSGLINP